MTHGPRRSPGSIFVAASDHHGSATASLMPQGVGRASYHGVGQERKANDRQGLATSTNFPRPYGSDSGRRP